MARTVYEVAPQGSRWKVQRRGAAKAAKTFKDKAPAIAYGKGVAKNNQPSQLVIKKQDGTIQTEYTYGDDPYPPSG